MAKSTELTPKQKASRKYHQKQREKIQDFEKLLQKNVKQWMLSLENLLRPVCNLNTLGAVHILCQLVMGGSIPSTPLPAKNQKLACPPPPLVRKIRNRLTPPPPIVRNHILFHSNYLGKPTFQEEILNFEIN